MVNLTFVNKQHYSPFRARIHQRRIRLPKRYWTDYHEGGDITSDADQPLLVFTLGLMGFKDLAQKVMSGDMEKLGLEEKKDLLYFIGELISLDEYWTANYYLRCLKKLPHGGVALINCPNFFLHHFRFEWFNLFVDEPIIIPYFLSKSYRIVNTICMINVRLILRNSYNIVLVPIIGTWG